MEFDFEDIRHLLNKPVPFSLDYETFFDITGIGSSENAITKTYAWFLHPHQKTSQLFLDSILQALSWKTGIQLEGFVKSISVERVLDDGKRVDMVILVGDGQKDFEIIVENKIYHQLNNPLLSYLKQRKLPPDKKIGIVLSLRPEIIPRDCKGQFHNITHDEVIGNISDGLSAIELDSRQSFILNDFLHTIKQICMNDKMDEATELYFENADKVNHLISLKGRAGKFIEDQLRKSAAELEMKFDWYTSNYDLRYIYEDRFGNDFYYTIFYDGLFTGESRLRIVIEFWENKDRRKADMEAVIQNEFKNTANEYYQAEGFQFMTKNDQWCSHFLAKDYWLTIDHLKNLHQFVCEKIRNDFDKEYQRIAHVELPPKQ
jgi:hypothetical protein